LHAPSAELGELIMASGHLFEVRFRPIADLEKVRC